MKPGKNEKYLKFIRSLPCCFCGAPGEPHHVIGLGMGKMGGRAYDIHSVSLCRGCHDAVHQHPAEWPQAKWLIETQEEAVKAGVL